MEFCPQVQDVLNLVITQAWIILQAFFIEVQDFLPNNSSKGENPWSPGVPPTLQTTEGPAIYPNSVHPCE